MLYILFGRDHIGKGTVRDHLAETYGLIIIPKFTNDKHKEWKIRCLRNDYEYEDSESFKLNNENSEFNQFAYNKKLEHRISNSGVPFKLDDCYDKFVDKKKNEYKSIYSTQNAYACAKNDDYLLYRFEKPKGDDLIYEISKSYKTRRPYSAKYYIKRTHVKSAIENLSNNYILVCTSGKVIDEIEVMCKGKDVVKLIFVDGTEKSKSGYQSQWVVEPKLGSKTEQPAYYFIRNSYKFKRITNDTYLSANNKFDRDKFSIEINKQWESICNTLPLKLNAFLIRPFKPSYEDSVLKHLDTEININNLFQNALEKKVNNILENRVKFVYLSDFKEGDLLNRIKKAIAYSHIVFVDLRYHRNNCYYEYGFANGIREKYGKRVFCLIGIRDSGNETTDIEAINDGIKNVWAELEETTEEIAFDVSKFSHYKYLLRNITSNDDGSPQIDLHWVPKTNQEKSLEMELRDFYRPITVDVEMLVKENFKYEFSGTARAL
ncbi:MAG: hypothetical protein LBI42_10750 [Chitinispirillales bacterium]|jgi:hypothetical protein|nr:hypothetical protein [Chitinispirillales bacterium]